ncbi:unnamed protein product [Adineta ricciae]|uniref:Smr domain-containing protein n=1 Tax=Adineta ricciae TaxID=249248 RepID=A0A813X112_ADIRI|nr:unnamed protein product [Adineta ricciae]CAF1338668.1 unnamed protein product [Adineta ricciae]
MGNLFSHTNQDEQSGIPREALALRNEARQLLSEAQLSSKQSQDEYQHGCRARAKELSIRKNAFYAQMNDKNEQAARIIFQHFNRTRPNNEIDLHGLYVNEALNYLENKMNKSRSENVLQLKVITGMGNNSPNRISKIKPQVEEFVRRNSLQATIYPGHLIINLFTSENSTTKNPSSNTDQCIIL